ncbi:MAG: hypothetical protein JXQ27_05040 [Acidobacteria bacterium]|nr:hypothetical protein [Acidobacteriota bacterium]
MSRILTLLGLVLLVLSVDGSASGLAGDVNGDGIVNEADVVSLNRLLAGDPTAGPLDVETADVNADGRVNIDDVLYLRISLQPEFRPSRVRCLYNGYLLTVNPYDALSTDSPTDRYRLMVLHAILIHPDTGRIIATYPALAGGPGADGLVAHPIDDYPQLLTEENPDPPGMTALQVAAFWRAQGIGDNLLLGSEYLDLQGKVVTPGLIDTHFHVTSWSKKLPGEGERFGFYADVGDPHYYTDVQTWDRVCVRQALWEIVADANDYIAEEDKAGVYLHGYWYTLIDDPAALPEEETFLFQRTGSCLDSAYNPDYLLNRVGLASEYPFQVPADPCSSDPATWPPVDYEIRPAVLIHTSGQACWYNSALMEAFNEQQENEWGTQFPQATVESVSVNGPDGSWLITISPESPAMGAIMALEPPFAVDIIVAHPDEAHPWYVPFYVTAHMDDITLQAMPILLHIADSAFSEAVESLAMVPFYRPIPACIPLTEWDAAAVYWGEYSSDIGVAYGYWSPINPYGTNWYNGSERGLLQYFLDEDAQVWRPTGYAEHYVMRDMLSSLVVDEVTVDKGMEFRQNLARWCHRHGLTTLNDIMFYRRETNPLEFWANAGLSFDRRFPGQQMFYQDHALAPEIATGQLNLRIGLYYYLENAADVEAVLALAAPSPDTTDVGRLRPPAIHPEFPGWVRWLGWKLQLDGGTGARTFFSNAPLVKIRREDTYPTTNEAGDPITFLNHSFGLLTMTNLQEQEFTSRESAALYWLVRESNPGLPQFYNPEMVGDWTFLQNSAAGWLELAQDSAELQADLETDLAHLDNMTWLDEAQPGRMAEKVMSALEQVESGWKRTLMAMAAIWYWKSVSAAADTPIPGQTVCHCIGDGAVDLYVRAIKQLKTDVENFPEHYEDLPDYWQAVIPPGSDLMVVQRQFNNTRFRVEHLLNFACGAIDDLKGAGGIDSQTSAGSRNVVFSTQPSLLVLDGQAIREGFPIAQELWAIPNTLLNDFWQGVPPLPRAHHHMPCPVYIQHDIPFTLNTDPPSVRDPRPAITLIGSVARLPLEIDPSHWLDQTGAEPDYRPPDYLVGQVFGPLGLTPDTPENPMALTTEQALSAMTYWAAYVAGWENEIGALAVAEENAASTGWFADLVVWNVNPLAIAGPTGLSLEQLGRIPAGVGDAERVATLNMFIAKFLPRMTLVGGVPVYTAPLAAAAGD